MMKKVNQKMIQKSAKQVQIGDYIRIKGQPCIVLQTLHSKPGKHLMKALLKGKCVFNERIIDDLFRFDDKIQILSPIFSQYEVAYVDETFVAYLIGENKQLKQIIIQDIDRMRQYLLNAFKDCEQKQFFKCNKLSVGERKRLKNDDKGLIKKSKQFSQMLKTFDY